MSLIYITGAPGVGKTTLQKEFAERGYDVRDLDNSFLGGPHNKDTGEVVTIPPAEQRTPEWFNAHEWRVYPAAFEKLKFEAADKNIFIFGVASTDGEILHLFDKIMYLSVDDETLKGRIANRKGNDYGRNEFELKEILERKHALDDRHSSPEVLIINGTNALDVVAEQIISLV